MKTVAYIAGEFPRLSETFVYREVRGLRKRGWRVIAVSLHPSQVARGQLDDLMLDRIVVYGLEGAVGAAFGELVLHPVRSLATLAGAVGDAIRPGEKTCLATRLKLVAQAWAGLGLARRLRPLGVEHIHCHFAHAPASVGMYAARQLGLPFSFTGHANDIFERRALLAKKLRRARFVACISHWHREFYEAIIPDTQNKYEVIRCGVDVAPLSPSSRNGEAITNGVNVLTVCRLVEKKGVDTLIEAAAMLKGRGMTVDLTVAGDGPDQERLAKLADEKGCVVNWLGPVPNEKVFDLLTEADVFALPCRQDSRGDRDGIPVVLMEAMAGGVAVVSGDLPAIRELIEDGKTGLLVEGAHPAKLADKIQSLADDASLRKTLAGEGRKKVESEFSLEMNLDRLEKRLSGATR